MRFNVEVKAFSKPYNKDSAGGTKYFLPESVKQQLHDRGVEIIPNLSPTIGSEGIRIAIALNLAASYAEPVRRHYPSMDAYGFSFAIGAMKPEPFLYRATCELLGADTDDYFGNKQVLMIGDSEKCDRDGPPHVRHTWIPSEPKWRAGFQQPRGIRGYRTDG